MARKNINTTLDEELYKKVQIIAIYLDKKANELIEEGMQYIIDKYKGNLPEYLGGNDARKNT